MKKLPFFALIFLTAAPSAFAAATITYCKSEEYCVAANSCGECGSNYEQYSPAIDEGPITCSPAPPTNADLDADEKGTISQMSCTWQ